jgi:hypothetical protein
MQPNEITIERSKKKTALSALIGVVFVALGGWMVGGGIPDLGGLAVAIGAISSVVFGVFLALHLRMLVDRSPGLIIGPDGFTDASSAVPAGLVRWDDIVGLSITTISGQRMLTVQVRDPAPYLNRGNALQRRVHRINSKLTGSSINLASNGLKISFEAMVAALQEGLARSRAGGGGQRAPDPARS